jgi:plastocyanin
MQRLSSAAILPLLALAGCGGGGGGGGVSTNSFTGTVVVAGGAPSATCVATHAVTISAAAVSPDLVDLAVGDCIRFTASDAGPHQIAAREATGCSELDQSGTLTGVGQTFTTRPFAAAKTCHWEDAENPPAAGGGY